MPCSIGQNLWKSARQHSSTLSFFLLVTGVLHLETRYISRLMIDSLIISSLFVKALTSVLGTTFNVS